MYICSHFCTDILHNYIYQNIYSTVVFLEKTPHVSDTIFSTCIKKGHPCFGIYSYHIAGFVKCE